MELSPLAYIGDNDIALVAIFFIFGMPVIAWLMMRGMKHRERQMQHIERIEMIRHGINPGTVNPAEPYVPGPSAPLPDPTFMRDSVSSQAALQKGMILAAVGLAITLGLSFIGYGPWLIGGFIPLFIGVVQIWIAMNAGAQVRMGPAPTQRPPGPPPPPPGATPHPGATYEGSYTYRPGATQELRPPAPPPAER